MAIVSGGALVLSVAWLGYTITVRDASQIPLLAAGAAACGIAFLALAVYALRSTWRAGVEGRTGLITGEGTGPDWTAVHDLMAQAVADRRARAAAPRQVQDVEWRDNPSRVDAELLAAGIGPGHASLMAPPDLDR